MRGNWMEGLLWAEEMVIEYGYKSTLQFFRLNIVFKSYDEFDRGFQAYLKNFRFRSNRANDG